MQIQKNIKILLLTRDSTLEVFFSSLLEPTDFLFYTAATAEKGQEAIKRSQPDLALIHIEDYGNVLIALSRIRAEFPIPVLLVTRNKEENAEIADICLKLGAVDVIEIPASDKKQTKLQNERLMRSLATAASVKMETAPRNVISGALRGIEISQEAPSSQPAEHEVEKKNLYIPKFSIVGIAISTGGPNALRTIIPSFPADFNVPVMVVQHIIPGFLDSIVGRLDDSCAVRVKIAEDEEPLAGGTIYFAPDKLHLKADVRGGRPVCVLDEKPDDVLFRPSADVLFDSIVSIFKGRTLGVIMTGMGKDGVKGIGTIKVTGGTTIAQDQQTSAIYGMARVAVDANLIDYVLPLNKIVSEIVRLVT